MAKAKRKRCKICNELFTPQYSSLQETCSVTHAIEYSRLKKAATKAQLNALRNEKISLSKLNEDIDQTRVIVNTYIRERDKGKMCISCTSILTDSTMYDAGHIFSVKQHNAIRFDFDIIYGQCRRCNRQEEGNYDVARAQVRWIVGEDSWRVIEEKAHVALRVPYTWTRHELKAIRDEARRLLRELKLKQ